MSEIENDLGLPQDPSKMTRKERRVWYHKNRKRFNLPAWGDLQSVIK